MDLGENIYALRTAKHMSQGALAEALNVSHQSISKWENGGAMPELEKLIKMSRIFNVSLDEMVNGQRQPPAPLPKKSPGDLHRTVGGWLITLFGAVFLMLSLWWSEPMGIEITAGGLVSAGLLLMGWALLSDFKISALAASTLVYAVCVAVSQNLLAFTDPTDHLFLGIYGLLLMGWALLVCRRMARKQKNN